MNPVPVRTLPVGSSRLCGRLRRGYNLIEVLATIAVLTSLMAAWLPMQHTVARRQRAGRQRQVALFEAAGALERLSAWPLSELTPQRAAEIDLSVAARHALPEAQLHVDVRPNGADEPPGRRVAVRVTWRESPADQQPRQVELVTWRYAADARARPDGEDQP